MDYVIRTGCTKTNTKVAEFITPIFEKYATLKANNIKQGADDGKFLRVLFNEYIVTTPEPNLKASIFFKIQPPTSQFDLFLGYNVLKLSANHNNV